MQHFYSMPMFVPMCICLTISFLSSSPLLICILIFSVNNHDELISSYLFFSRVLTIIMLVQLITMVAYLVDSVQGTIGHLHSMKTA